MTNLERLRREAKMSQEQLAEKSGVSRAVISKIETGGIDGVICRNLMLLADALNVNVAQLF